MKCHNCGAEIEGAKFCPECGTSAPKAIPCPRCGFEHDKKFCPECGEATPVNMKCAKCGTEHNANFCPNCGTSAKQENAPTPPQPTAPIQQPQIVINNTNTNTNANVNTNTNTYSGPQIPPKSKMVALVLCILLGIYGAHNFYTGKIGMGILYLFTAGLFGIGWIVDIIRIITGSFRDKYGQLLV